LSLAYAGNDQGERTKAGSTTFTNTIMGVGSETGSASTYYTRDNKGSLLGQRTPSGKYYYLFDGLGSVVALTDSTASVAAGYKYDPYGKQTSTTGTVTNPWRFAGQYYDSSTGLYKMGARYYNPGLGRWTQQDPIRQIGSFRQSDRYPYAGDDPINLTDPTGMRSLGQRVAGFAAGTVAGIATTGIGVVGFTATAGACTGGLGGEGCLETATYSWAAFGTGAIATYESFDYAFGSETSFPQGDYGACGLGSYCSG